MTTEDVFWQTLEADPSDRATRLIFSDWLAQEGRAAEANGQRWQARNGQWPRWCAIHGKWDWWAWTDGYLPHEFERGYFESVLPVDVFHTMIANDPDGAYGALFTTDTLRAAETALAQALYTLEL